MRSLVFAGLVTVLGHTAFVGSRMTLSLFAIQLGASPFTVGLLMSLFGTEFATGGVFAAVAIGAAFGMLFGVISYALTGGRRDFISHQQLRADVYEVIRAHQDFQGRHYYHHFGGDPNAREKYEGAPWFALAAQFADEWDQVAFDPDYDTLPLEHFEPLVRDKMARGRIV